MTDAPLPRRVLIANRGEIARRIARTCRAVGVATVAVHSEVDEHAWHVADCDQAVRLDGRTPAESYLRIDALLDAALRTGCDAVHPGYGFLSEDPAFATAVEEAGLTWIGPTAEVIATMADKLAAKRMMREMGVPLVRGAELPEGGDVRAAGEEVGFPLLVKAAAGGGGKGMRVVRSAEDLRDAVDGARREAAGAFGDPTVFLERYIDDARHVEVQLLGDAHGDVVHLFERECSVQRRHQKVIEEAPSPGIDPEVRAALQATAVEAGVLLGYRSAGTLELIADERLLAARRAGHDVDPMDCFAFLEINTRLQVEHPVTEETVRFRDPSGYLRRLDLVLEQLRIAAGHPLRYTQSDLVQVGHAIEARLYAEDPAAGYLPQSGRLEVVVPGGEEDGVRWDRGVRSGDVVSTYYDPMIAKVIVAAEARADAAAVLARALSDTVLLGPRTNRDLLVDVLRHPRFLSGETTTDHLETHHAAGGVRELSVGNVDGAAIAVALVTARRRSTTADPQLPRVRPGFTSSGAFEPHLAVRVDDRDLTVRYRQDRDGWSHCTVTDGAAFADRDEAAPRELVARVRATTPADADELPGVADTWIDIEVELVRTWVRVTSAGPHHVVSSPVGRVVVAELPRFPETSQEVPQGAVLAPMPGSVVTVAVAVGDQVVAGQLLCTVEAMKMEHRVTAAVDGTVTQVPVDAGQQVDADELLVLVTPAEGGGGPAAAEEDDPPRSDGGAAQAGVGPRTADGPHAADAPDAADDGSRPGGVTSSAGRGDDPAP